MADIGKEFFLARSEPSSSVATNAIPVPAHLHLLEQRAFVRGEGAKFRQFLLGPVATGEIRPRVLPRAVFDGVERFVDQYRRKRAGHDTAYLVQLVGEGGKLLSWEFEPTVGLRESRYRLDDNHMRIKCFRRTLHYAVRITAFDDAPAMNRWYRAYGVLPLPMQKDYRQWLAGDGSEADWFEAEGWQRLPHEFLARLNEDAKALVFPSYWKQFREALYRDRFDIMNPFLFVPELTYHFISATDHHHGPEDSVWTLYRARYRVDFHQGVFHG